MNRNVKIMLLSLGCAVLVVAFSLQVPRAVHAAVAALVEVANTPANPVPNKNVDQPARHLFTTQCTAPPTVGTTTSCVIAPTAGEVVVIQSVSILAGAASTNTTLAIQIDTTSGTQPFSTYFQALDDGFLQPGDAFFEFTGTANIYMDPSTGLSCTVLTRGPNPAPLPLTATCFVSGYYVTFP